MSKAFDFRGMINDFDSIPKEGNYSSRVLDWLKKTFGPGIAEIGKMAFSEYDPKRVMQEGRSRLTEEARIDFGENGDAALHDMQARIIGSFLLKFMQTDSADLVIEGKELPKNLKIEDFDPDAPESNENFKLDEYIDINKLTEFYHEARKEVLEDPNIISDISDILEETFFSDEYGVSKTPEELKYIATKHLKTMMNSSFSKLIQLLSIRIMELNINEIKELSERTGDDEMSVDTVDYRDGEGFPDDFQEANKMLKSYWFSILKRRY